MLIGTKYTTRLPDRARPNAIEALSRVEHMLSPPAPPFQVGRASARTTGMWSEEWTEPPLAMPPGVPPAPRRVPPNKGGSNELPHMPFELSSDDTLSQRLMEVAHAQRHEAASAIQLALHQSAGTTVNRQQVGVTLQLPST